MVINALMDTVWRLYLSNFIFDSRCTNKAAVAAMSPSAVVLVLIILKSCWEGDSERSR